ncbi:odorant receptor 4-like [Osmia bicornis bicornis]|uniref:odorant receptor 4-like n=1 Tax=Osmia bicornis bicornis TaxID=1437191 RepID=UPI001EAEEA39|nr:odorant receptor 4-like [Osmia bicornis bicornis]
MIILNSKRASFADALFCAQQHFWHGNYNSEERLIFSISVKYCTLYVVFAIGSLQIALSGYVITPIVENIGRNKSDRVLPFKMWVDLPLTETPYFELAFASQAISVYLIGAAYICPEMFLCVFNLHVMGQFRILQHRMLNFWNVESKGMNADTYTDHCYAALKKCIKHHQLLIEFCKKLEQVYTMPIFTHMVVLSLLLCFDAYEIVVVPRCSNKYVDSTLTVSVRTTVFGKTPCNANTSPSLRVIFLFHGVGSLGQLLMITYTCHFMMEESTNIITTMYSGSWSTLPMNDVGRSFRSAMKFIMIRSLKPCCLTAAGFFPLTLETFTSLLSSTFSYFTLMRQSFMRSDGE